MIKNRMILILILLCIFSYVSPVAQSSLKIWPAKLTISMPEGYSNGTIFYQIEVTNPYTYEVNASARIENPDVLQLSEGYTCIPNLTWVNISPQTLHLPANTAGYFGVSLDIPEKEKQFYYNNSWETWVVISSDGPSGELGGVALQIELAVKLFINTPPSAQLASVKIYYFLFFLLVAIGVTIYALLYWKKRHLTKK